MSKTGGLIVNRWDVTGERLPSYVRPYEPVTLGPRGKPSKYLFPSRALASGQGKRLDVHPVVRERLLTNKDDPVYFCLEGCLKADAVAGTGRISISVTSITMWKVERGLEPWLPLLRWSPIVYVVPDSDYKAKRKAYGPGEPPVFVQGGEVRYFTDRCVIFYRREHGVRMHHLVPPYLSEEEAAQRGLGDDKRWKIGIDDHIAWGGNFDPWDRETNPRGVHLFQYRRESYRRLPGVSRDYRTDVRDRAFIDWLERSHGSFGRFSMSDAARDLGWNREKVRQAKLSCIRRGEINVWDEKPLGPERGNGRHVFRFTDGSGQTIKGPAEVPGTNEEVGIQPE